MPILEARCEDIWHIIEITMSKLIVPVIPSGKSISLMIVTMVPSSTLVGQIFWIVFALWLAFIFIKMSFPVYSEITNSLYIIPTQFSLQIKFPWLCLKSTFFLQAEYNLHSILRFKFCLCALRKKRLYPKSKTEQPLLTPCH